MTRHISSGSEAVSRRVVTATELEACASGLKSWFTFFVLVNASWIACCWSTMCSGQQPFNSQISSGGLRGIGTNHEAALDARVKMVIEVALMAADRGRAELSVNAAMHAADMAGSMLPQYGVVPVQGLATNAAAARPGSSVVRRTMNTTESLSNQELLLKLVHEWKRSAPTSKVYADGVVRLVIPNINGTDQSIRTLFGSAPDLNAVKGIRQEPEWSLRYPFLPFEMLGWAHRTGTLDELHKKLVEQGTTSDWLWISLTVLADRYRGEPGVAIERATDALKNSSALHGQGHLLARALVERIDSVPSSRIEWEQVSGLLAEIEARDNGNVNLLPFLRMRIDRAVESGDQGRFRALMARVAGAEPMLADFNEESKGELQRFLYVRCARKAAQHGHRDWSIELYTKAREFRSKVLKEQLLDESDLLWLADAEPAERRLRAEKYLLESPIYRIEDLGFAYLPLRPPVDFVQPNDPRREEVADRLQPYPGSGTISMLDLALNECTDAEAAAVLIAKLKEKAADSQIVRDFLDIWVEVRLRQRHSSSDSRSLVEAAKFKTNKEFIAWCAANLPLPALRECMKCAAVDASFRETYREAWSARVTTNPWNPSAQDQMALPDIGTDGNSDGGSDGNSDGERLKHWMTVGNDRMDTSLPKNSYELVVPNSNGASMTFRGGEWTWMIRYPLAAYSMHADWEWEEAKSVSFTGHELSYFPMVIAGTPMLQHPRASIASRASNTAAEKATRNDVRVKSESNLLNYRENTRSTQIKVLSTAYPFFGIGGGRQRIALPADFQIDDTTTIRPKVELIQPALLGWNEIGVAHTLERPSSVYEQQVSNAGSTVVFRDSRIIVVPGSERTEWHVEAGELKFDPFISADEFDRYQTTKADSYGQRLAAAGNESVLYYNRPLQNGERIDAEFYCDASGSMPDLTLGRIAYRFVDGRIRLHWCVDAERNSSEPAADNLVDDPQGHLLSQAEWIKDGWNKLSVRIEGGQIILAVNGKDVYSRPPARRERTEPGICVRFDRPARVRNMVLSGNWPTEFPKDIWETVEPKAVP